MDSFPPNGHLGVQAIEGDGVLLTRWKFEQPVFPHRLINRRELAQREFVFRGGTTLLVAAAPGYGKTSLLLQLAEQASAATAWLTIDGDDDEPASFWRSLVASLIVSAGPRGEGDLHWPPPDALEGETLVVEWLLAQARRDRRRRLIVLDDFELISDSTLLGQVDAFAAHLPEHWQLVVATKREPEMALARLRTTGRLLEFREEDLCFDAREAEELVEVLRGEHVEGESDLERLVEATEGWPAALYLALTHPKRSDHLGVKERLKDTAAVLAESFGEVLRAEDAAIARFLIEASTLGTFTPLLAEAASANPDSAALIDRCRRRHLFLSQVDDEEPRYRFHALFCHYLARQQSRLGYSKDRVAGLHRRAAEHLEAEDDESGAIDHYLGAGEYDRAFSLLASMIPRTGDQTGEDFERWVDRFPSEYLASDPSRMVSFSLALMAAGQLERARQWLALALARSPGGGSSPLAVAITAAESSLHRLDGDMVSMTASARQVLERAVPGRDDEQVVRMHLNLALGAVLRHELSDAWRELDLARLTVAPGEISDRRILAASSFVAYVEGRLYDAERLANAILAEERTGTRQWSLNSMLPRLTIGMLAREHGELSDAERTARDVIARTERTGMRLVQRLAVLLLTRTLISDGRRADAFEALGGYDGWGSDDATEYVAARLALELGTSSPASRLLSRGGNGTADQLLTARVHLRDGYADAASRAMQQLEPQHLSIRQSLEHALLRALSAPAGNEVVAREWLGKAIAVAEAERFVRVFSDEGAEMFDLLHSVSPEVDRAYLWNIYEAFDSVPLPRPAALLEPLSRRERAILRYLPTRLHNAEIGRELYVSHNTVKTHVRAIYRKLGVNSRWGAVERARELHLL